MKKSSGHVTRPKVLLKDVRRPPLRREIDTSAATCLRIGVLTIRQVDKTCQEQEPSIGAGGEGQIEGAGQVKVQYRAYPLIVCGKFLFFLRNVR